MGALMTTELQAKLVSAVKKEAHANYETGGWDFVVEGYSDTDIRTLIKGCRTEASAIKKVAKVARCLDEYRREGRGSE